MKPSWVMSEDDKKEKRNKVKSNNVLSLQSTLVIKETVHPFSILESFLVSVLILLEIMMKQ
jgi:hypothetical protein